MPFPVTIAAAKAFVTSRKFLIPAGIVLFLLAVAFGTYRYLDKQTEEKVAAAVENVNIKATNQTLEAHNRVQAKNAEIDVQAIRNRIRTAKDYQNVRNQVEAAPAPSREAGVPPLIIHTLNELDRLRNDRANAGRVPDSAVPVG